MTETPTKTRAETPTRRATRHHCDAYALEAEIIKALAHPKRLLILDLLSDGAEHTVTDLLPTTELSQSNLSQNLAVLRTSGLVHARRDGVNVHYSVKDKRVMKAVALLRGVLGDQLGDKQLILERADLRARERAKRTALLGSIMLVTALVALASFAALHPVLAGGTMNDVAPHVQLMLSQPGMDSLFRACAERTPEAMTHMGSSAA